MLVNKLVMIRFLKCVGQFSSKVPENPVYKVISKKDLPAFKRIDQTTIEQLEHLALTDFANQAGIQRLEEAIQFADQLSVVDTTGVKPMITPLEDRFLYLEEDKVTDGNCRKEILQNASMVEENYFIAPLGRIIKDSDASEDTEDNNTISNIQIKGRKDVCE